MKKKKFKLFNLKILFSSNLTFLLINNIKKPLKKKNYFFFIPKRLDKGSPPFLLGEAFLF